MRRVFKDERRGDGPISPNPSGTFLGTAIDAMKPMLTTFIIPFAFCYHPQLLKFPNVGWDVPQPLLQATTSAFCYGYLFVELTQMDRWLALALTLGGLTLLVNWSQTGLIVFGALLAITLPRAAMLLRRAAPAEA